MAKPHLALYYFDACPYCQFVMDALERLEIQVEMCDIHADINHLNKLVNDTGRRTVPCLYIDGRPMHESADIVRWLEANASKLSKNG